MAALLTHRRRGPGSIPSAGTLAEIVSISQKRLPPGIEPTISRLEDPRAATELISEYRWRDGQPNFLRFQPKSPAWFSYEQIFLRSRKNCSALKSALVFCFLKTPQFWSCRKELVNLSKKTKRNLRVGPVSWVEEKGINLWICWPALMIQPATQPASQR